MNDFLSNAGEKQVVATIAEVEKKTSGEIHVHLSQNHVGKQGVMGDAVKTFKALGLERTKQSNGVLIYVSVRDRKFAILGDQGIHEKIGDSGWNAIARSLHGHFARGQNAQGLVAAIQAVGEVLTAHFPPEAQDAGNELTDEISRS